MPEPIKPVKQRKLLSQRHPALYFIAVGLRRLQRRFSWYTDSKTYSKQLSGNNLEFRIKKHQSVLLKKLGESDMQLQVNKVTNIKLAIKNINGIIVNREKHFLFAS